MGESICSNCGKTLKEPSRFCGECGKAIPGEEFHPLDLAIGGKKRLMEGRNAICDLHFTNHDCDTIETAKLLIESKALDEPCEHTVRNIKTGQNPVTGNKRIELTPTRYGDTLFNFELSYTDCNGDKRVYTGVEQIEIQAPRTSGGGNVIYQGDVVNIRGKIGRADSSAGDGESSEDLSWSLDIELELKDFKPSKPAEAKAPPKKEEEIASLLSSLSREPFPLPMERAKMVYVGDEKGGKKGRKILLIARETLAMGLKKYTKESGVDLTLRLLPCRSKALDPRNWEDNRLISSPHVTIKAEEDRFLIRDEKGSKNGTYLIDVISRQEDPAPSSVGDGETMFHTPMEPDEQLIAPNPASGKQGEMRPLPKGEWETLPVQCDISIGRRILILRARTYASSKKGLYALRLTRIRNQPDLEYIQVIRRLYIGSGPKCPIRATHPDLPALAAALDYRNGRFSLTAGIDDPPVCLDGEPIEKGRKKFLKRPSLIGIGDCLWRFEAALIQDFTEV